MAKTFGAKIRDRRQELRLTLENVAEMIGSTKSYVWELEKKKKARPSAEIVIKLSKVLSLPAEYLIDDEKDKPFDDDYDESETFFQQFLHLNAQNKEILRQVAETLRNVELDETVDESKTPETSLLSVGEDEDFGVTLGKFVQLKRREMGISVEELARQARITLKEISNIESDIFYSPKPRTLHQLESVFNVSSGSLAKLSNALHIKPTALKGKKSKFAAQSGELTELTDEERNILGEYVVFLDSLTSD